MALSIVLASGCETRVSGYLSPRDRAVVAATIDSLVRDAYDPTRPGMEARMLALYADTGRIVSASAGRAITARDTVMAGIHAFWRYVGENMRDPRWIWTSTYVDVLSPSSAVFTGTYHVPHHTPAHQPHDIGGTMTLVFVKRGEKWGVVQEHLSDAPPAAADSIARHPMEGMTH